MKSVRTAGSNRLAKPRCCFTIIFCRSSNYQATNKVSAYRSSSAIEEDSIIKPIHSTIFVALELIIMFVVKFGDGEALDVR